MNANDFADAPGSDGTRFGRGFHRSNIATHEDRDVAIEEVFFANQNDVGRFNHRDVRSYALHFTGGQSNSTTAW